MVIFLFEQQNFSLFLSEGLKELLICDPPPRWRFRNSRLFNDSLLEILNPLDMFCLLHEKPVDNLRIECNQQRTIVYADLDEEYFQEAVIMSFTGYFFIHEKEFRCRRFESPNTWKIRENTVHVINSYSNKSRFFAPSSI